jgi:sigma-B regulation protein RsbU (phosphoserine phosphatase)
MQAIHDITPQTPDVRPWLRAGRQAIQDLEDVRRVNACLFPRELPQLAGIAYAGVCIEANFAGGDFYDFFDCGRHRLGLAVGDVSGKGVASALLRATLQAGLRAMRLTGLTDFENQLTLANRLLLESAPEAMYSSLFFAEYDERSRRLRYVNCGHPAPLLLRGEKVSWLQPNATLLGLFTDWQCSIAEVQLQPGDTLLIYTDGASEARGAAGEEFGQDRLLAMLKAQNDLPLSMFLQECVNEVYQFAQGNPCDDLTLVAFRCLQQEV